MFEPRQHENNFLFLLRWTARIVSALSIGILLLFILGEGIDLSQMTWEEKGILLLIPVGLINGPIHGQAQSKGGALAVCGVAAFDLAYGILDIYDHSRFHT